MRAPNFNIINPEYRLAAAMLILKLTNRESYKPREKGATAH
jgi:hypothetical protein